MMGMLQMYQGSIEKGRFLPVQSISIPDLPVVYLVVENTAVEQPETKAQKQNAALKRFFAAIDEITNEPITGADMAVLEQNRVNFHRELGV